MGRVTVLVIATTNRHKLAEIRAILGPRYRYLSLQDFPEAPKVVEDEKTFSGNAMKKARELARFLQDVAALEYRVPGVNALVVADDSGLEVDALNGAPGVHSARFAALDQDGNAGGLPRAGGEVAEASPSDAENNAKLLALLRAVPLEKRAARFRCVIASVRLKPLQPVLAGQTFEGVCEGRIQMEGRGQGGFGYDPLFQPLQHPLSFAQLAADSKNKISHRAQALDKFRRYLETLRL